MILFTYMITFILFSVKMMDYHRHINLELSDDLNKLRTALIIPCTIKDLIMNAPLLFQSIVNATPSPAETIVVFGVKNTLTEEINRIFPRGKSKEMDTLRKGLISFFIQFGQIDSQVETDLSIEWSELNDDDKSSFKDLEASAYLTGLLKNINLRRIINEDFTLLINNNLKALKGIVSLIALGDRIPNFRILLNYTEYPYANSNREYGTMAAFGKELQDNEIVSYIDCDDEMTPHRVHMIEQSFEENPDITGIIHGWIPRDYRNPEKFEKYRNKWMDVIGPDHTPFEEIKNELYNAYFPFRNDYYKRQVIDLQEDVSFFGNKDDENFHSYHPSDLTLGNNEVGYGWWLFQSEDQNLNIGHLYGMKGANGHPSFRRKWAVEKLTPFPNIKRGEDARLNRLNVWQGGAFLFIPAPLTVVGVPSGMAQQIILDRIIKHRKY